MIMAVLLIGIVGALNMGCFFLGAKVGQKVSRGETIESPTLNPVKIIEEAKEKKQQRKELEQLEVIMQNIESYNGTSSGQREVPKG